MDDSTITPSLARALARWVERGDAKAVVRLLDAELDGEGLPRRWPVSSWWPILSHLADRPDGPGDRVDQLVRTALRFSRPDGSAVFGPEKPGRERSKLLKTLADASTDPALATVVRWWFPSRSKPKSNRHAPPPLPAASAEGRPLAMLRADWSPRGDFLAIDARGPSHLVELFGRGRPLLGPSWSPGHLSGSARLTRWSSDSRADLAEWSFRAPSGRVTRTAVMLRGRSLALLADQVVGPGEAATRLALPEGIEATAHAEDRSLVLGGGKGELARVVPLGLPTIAYPTERGSLAMAGREIKLTHSIEGRRGWLPLIVSWRAERHRKPPHWRVLTVTEKSKIVPAETAFAARVAWGPVEHYVVYRSLARPAPRAFLGHQTSARFLIGLFTPEAKVEPIVTIEDE